MALIECPGCKQQISNKTKICPNCGYYLKEKSGFGFGHIAAGIFLVITVLIIIFLILVPDYSNDKVINNNHTYSQNWRSPVGNEYVKIGRIIVQNGIKVCGEYYIKEIDRGELVIACTKDGILWEYFVVYMNVDKIYRANDEMKLKLTPPR